MIRVRRAHVFVLALLWSSCGPNLPPTTVPAPPNPSFDSFADALQGYVDLTQPYRREAAQMAEQVPGKATPGAGAAESVRTRQKALADALKTKLRPAAKPGDLFKGSSDAIRKAVADAFMGPEHDLLMDALAEQNDEGEATHDRGAAMVNEPLMAPRVPPLLIEALPQLPKQLEYDFQGRTLILRDVDADVVADLLPDTLPETPPEGVPTVPSERVGAVPAAALPLPSLRGGMVFAAIGDSGSGDQAQEQVAKAMLGYFTDSRRFPFVLMLGDNLYHDDYMGEFADPYKPLLDRGVKFFAALGNHDRDLEIHYKPFNMNDRDYYSFDQGNARFVVLNSNHPTDPMQIKWFDGFFQSAGDKWRIVCFHHPLYFEAVTPNERLLDCGVEFRTSNAAQGSDADTNKWLASCRAAMAQTGVTN